MRKRTLERKKEIKLRRNFLPTFIITVFLWIGLISVIFLIDPQQKGAMVIFFLIAFFAFFFTLSIVFINSRRGFLLSLCTILFMILRYFGFGNWLNFLLILGVYIVSEIYFSQNL